VFGIKPGGAADLHGEYRKVTWTQLSATAATGATSVSLLEAVDWRVGERIVIATSDYSQDNADTLNLFPHETELRTITAISSDGKTVTFAEPLVYLHYGEQWRSSSRPGDVVDMRTEVGLLTRNIKFRGDTSGILLSSGPSIS